jgi:ankyrin repeat protein
MLLQHKADPSIKNFDGTTAFTNCITGIQSGRVTTDMTKLFLDMGADVDEFPLSGPAEGYTPLMMAARNEAPDQRFTI